MQELRWMEPLPDHTMEGGLRLLDELKWNITVTEGISTGMSTEDMYDY